jgi:hypothetical protein
MTKSLDHNFRPDPERMKKAEELQGLLREVYQLRIAKAPQKAIKDTEAAIANLEVELGYRNPPGEDDDLKSRWHDHRNPGD